MPIFRYTLKKILVSPSTWVIFALTLAVLGLSWSLPVALLTSSGQKIDWTKDLVLSMFLPAWKILSFTVFISLMLLIFIGVKATQIFRDEIDDGTLLILVSKPISRNRIWAEKWLSFQVTIVSFLFFNILLGGLLLAIPGIGGSVVYLTLLPYMGILFGIGLLFDLIFTSIVLLMSLVLNSKATIAITVGFAALINVFSQAIEPLVVIPSTYFELSHATAVYHDFEKKVTSDDITWFEGQLNNSNYKSDISTIMKKVYSTNIPDVPAYPSYYDPVREQEEVHKIIAKPADYPAYSDEEVALLKHIDSFSNAFRQWKEQSYEELMTSNYVGRGNGTGGIVIAPKNYVDYSVYNVIEALNLTISQNELDNFNTKITQKRVMRYFNIFYQLSYLWSGAWGENNALYISNLEYQNSGDPYLIAFDKDDNNYKVDTSSGTTKIINFPALITVYLLLGVGLLGTSWYVFNRRDFS
ncbi:ABC transporter permease [Spiroplasma platyhelix]|uniref:ABC transporter permease subunit n=1 Tax=Spiroplasma platyhelix PALS-1 TaxID=1276218 RepID=A0A846TWP1_9MOLU|nr:ABC transporter permease [Spiroplasma platyhelix]MBE4704081.1 hypothetical protein [Spiroplasma platyhelix PALS-1]NKE38451.1 ABC transporter permease subunit [Spiroplasma platyhelix PALS-1]UJB29339.1 hypothetical protein SPLAT_v1c05750 [Spiroplasma platyhelix PALS-1]